MKENFEVLGKELEIFEKNVTFLEKIAKKNHVPVILNMLLSLEEIKQDYFLMVLELALYNKEAFSLKDYRRIEIDEKYVEEFVTIKNTIKDVLEYADKIHNNEVREKYDKIYREAFVDKDKKSYSLRVADVQKEFMTIFTNLENRLINLQKKCEKIEVI